MLTVEEGMIVCLMVLSHMMRFVLVTSFIIVKENIKITTLLELPEGGNALYHQATNAFL